jgi:uncharacterized protein (DUF305 family)
MRLLSPSGSSLKLTLFVLSLLLSSCQDASDTTNGTGVVAIPATMMAALHRMAENSQALPPTGNEDLYFALLLRENHWAVVAMSALELSQGQDSSLRQLAANLNHAHQQLIVQLDTTIKRLQNLPPVYPNNTMASHHFTDLLDAATAGLHPAAHRTIEQVAGHVNAPNQGLRAAQANAGTGSIDRDFAALLLPHHQNSIRLAEAELQHGQDPALWQAARLILQDQPREIVQAQAWLMQHPEKPR